MQLVHQYLFESARRHPDKTAIICGERKLSYAELTAQINTCADALIVEGLRKSDRVMVLLHDNIDFVIACYAITRAGGIAVPLPSTSSQSEVQYIAKDCNPFMLISSRGDLAALPTLRDILSCHFLLTEEVIASPLHRDTMPMNGEPIVFDDTDRITKFMELQEADGAFILYSSGTSGEKKGILFTHRNAIHSTINTNAFSGIDPFIRELILQPLASSLGFGRVRCIFFVGGTAIVPSTAFDAMAIVQTLIDQQCTALSSTPSTLSLFIHQIESASKRVSLQLRFIELGGGIMPLAEKKKLLEIFSTTRICMHYGSTEAPRSTFLEFRTDQKKLDTAGRPSPHVGIAISNEQGKHLGRGNVGEILIRGEHVSAGYWQRDEQSRQIFLDGQWCKNGDIGFIDREGYLHVIGRKDELITMAGVKISPTDVEEKIHEAYPECEICVVGIPDPAGTVGEIPVLCYIAHDGKTIIPSELSIALSKKLDRNKIPRIVYRVDTFPRSENRILRHELRKQLLKGILHSTNQIL